MAYNKAKYTEAAEKYLHQGKIAQAVAEYQNILRNEPKDQVTLMTVGDLLVRQGETFRALEYFERLAQVFLAEGFVSKAIAIYKKIAKLAPEETRPVERLAELYVQQGVLSEARPIYLQLAELHQRAGRQAQAAAMLRKLLEAEPDNLRVQVRLAELSLAAGKPADAVAALRTVAEVMFRNGDLAEAVEYADRALKTDPDDLATMALKARALAAGSHRADAIALLQSLPGLDESGEAAELLLDLYLESGDMDRASDLAAKIFARKSTLFLPAHHVAVTLLESVNPSRALPMLDLVREAMMVAGEHERLSQSIGRAAEQLPESIEPREWLVELYVKSGDSFRLPEALAVLAGAYESAGQHERAVETYTRLVEGTPDNEVVQRNYEQLRVRLGLGSTPPPPETAAPVAPQPEGEAAPSAASASSAAEPALDDETQQFVTQSLTDVDLFSSYGLSQKAIDLLETILQRAPRHTPSLERLLDLYLGAGDDRRTAELAALLHQIHSERGSGAAADRFGDLQRRFERAAGLARGEAASAPPAAPAEAAPEFSVPAAEPDPAAEPMAESTPAAPEAAEEPATEPAISAEPTVDEVDLSEEWAALANQLEDPAAFGDLASTLISQASVENQDVAPASDAPAKTQPAYELELEAPATEALTADSVLQSLSSEFADALPAALAGSGGSQSASVPELPEAAEEPVSHLGDVFNEFRADLDDLGSNGEDLETHYNLGTAYREMGLLDEAISEFQKVAKAETKGLAFRYMMQCCTLLGLAFMEKGQPGIAAMWYERALEIPGLDQESVLALRYDLGVAQELAGDTAAARKSFSQVYGVNIDYRDVADRLAALGKGI